MSAVTELAVNVGTSAACQALCMPRASYYRHKHAAPRSAMAKRRSPRALALAERETVLAHLHSERFQDRSPAAVYATLLDEGEHHCSIRTMYRLLEQRGESRGRRDQLTHPPTGSQNFWLRLPISAGVGTSASCSDRRNGRTFTCT